MIHTTYSFYRAPTVVYNHMLHVNPDPDLTQLISHNVTKIIYLKKGDLNYTVEGKSYRATNNHLLFTPPGKMHRLEFNDKNAYDRYMILFDKKLVSSKIYGQIPKQLYVIDAKKATIFEQLFQKIDYYYNYFANDEFENILCNLIEEILYNILIIAKTSEQASPQFQANPIIVKAIDYIECHLYEDLTLDALCRELYISKPHLIRLFEQHMNTSPKKYIVTKRLDDAQKLLLRGAKPTDIYMKYGFSDYSSFWRSYKNHFGYTPTQTNVSEILLPDFL